MSGGHAALKRRRRERNSKRYTAGETRDRDREREREKERRKSATESKRGARHSEAAPLWPFLLRFLALLPLSELHSHSLPFLLLFVLGFFYLLLQTILLQGTILLGVFGHFATCGWHALAWSGGHEAGWPLLLEGVNGTSSDSKCVAG